MSQIFKDREKLSPRYIPNILPHREEEIRLLRLQFESSLQSLQSSELKVIQVIGPAGAGKTSSIIRFGERFKEEGRRLGYDIVVTYVNLKLQGGSRVILYRFLSEMISPEISSSGLSAEELLRQIVKYLKARRKFLLVLLDEVDYFVKSTRDGSVIYDLTRINELDPSKPLNILGVILTARDTQFYDRLDAAELSTLGRIPIHFNPYSEDQVMDIIVTRVEETFERGVVSEDVLRYIAHVTANPPVNGDIRYSLDLLNYAGLTALSRGNDVIDLDLVRKVHGQLHPTITSEDILSLPKREHIVALLGTVRALQIKKKPFVPLSAVRTEVNAVCEEMNIRPFESEKYLQDLADRRIIKIESLNEVGITEASTESLHELLNVLVERVRHPNG
jgi:cell division control protein 6